MQSRCEWYSARVLAQPQQFFSLEGIGSLRVCGCVLTAVPYMKAFNALSAAISDGWGYVQVPSL
jgi:hypothetical protein